MSTWATHFAGLKCLLWCERRMSHVEWLYLLNIRRFMFRGTLWAESCLPTRYPKRVQSTQSFVPRRQSSEMTSLAVDFLCVISFGLSLSSSTPLYCHCSVQRMRKKSFRNPHGTPKSPLKIISAVKTPRNGDMPWYLAPFPDSKFYGFCSSLRPRAES